MAFFRDKPLDHGCFSPLSVLVPEELDWLLSIVPLQMGVLQFPMPSAARCYKLGQALRTAVESYPEDIKVVVVATGGLSHQVHGERCGFNNTPWDEEFLDLLERDPVALTRLTLADYARLGGMEGSEIIMWLVMRGALPAQINRVHLSYYLPSMTAIATAIYEVEPASLTAAEAARHREKMSAQFVGIERLEGTYPYTLERSAKGYRLNKFLNHLVKPEARARFLMDEEAEFAAAGLNPEECTLLRERNWRGLIHYGAIFFGLEKLGAVTGVSNPNIYAAMRGELLETFQKTRNAAIIYSVGSKA